MPSLVLLDDGPSYLCNRVRQAGDYPIPHLELFVDPVSEFQPPFDPFVKANADALVNHVSEDNEQLPRYRRWSVSELDCLDCLD